MDHALGLRGMTRLALEEEARLARGYASRILKGERLKLSPELLRRIADALQVSYEWLATGRGSLDDLSSPPPASASGARMQRSRAFALEAALAYHQNKWSAPTVAAARAMASQPEGEELQPPEWTETLDAIEAALGKIKLKRRAG
ncbi:helix-turn-helix domain-containing protein [Chondromyces apiculatus]|uniref:HTH cro/C1-type domain-containing protein n=1 Tax=Chondromyces apiculatus DSM 436 TaxID=1192034 RepID=A0A017TA12_9BACT|nr:helix-turn-helix transcriptional regulator [Chondromyces apiculatus]EYF06039.1 Hypothetical protein CAP_2229 [Chondromyces apiculatus DSM 436]